MTSLNTGIGLLARAATPRILAEGAAGAVLAGLMLAFAGEAAALEARVLGPMIVVIVANAVASIAINRMLLTRLQVSASADTPWSIVIPGRALLAIKALATFDAIIAGVLAVTWGATAQGLLAPFAALLAFLPFAIFALFLRVITARTQRSG